MKIGIHKSQWGFSADWLTYCERMGFEYKVIDCYSTNIIADVADCDIVMWHYHHAIAMDVLFSKQLLFALQQSGKIVFPEFQSAWHFDDKVGQKYLLEAIDAPIPHTAVFFSKKDAIAWSEKATFPKVFKLRGGAGSTNVKLIKTRTQAKQIISKAFGDGFSSYNGWQDVLENIRRYKSKIVPGISVLKSLRRLFTSTDFAKTVGRQKGYVLFQDFIEGNAFDVRVITIHGKAFAIKRLVREQDFRASGSGHIIYDQTEIDLRCIQIAFETTSKLDASVVAYDFVFDKSEPKIVEINYGYAHQAYFKCPGYWTRELKWIEGTFNSAEWIVDSMVENYRSRNQTRL